MFKETNEQYKWEMLRRLAVVVVMVFLWSTIDFPQMFPIHNNVNSDLFGLMRWVQYQMIRLSCLPYKQYYYFSCLFFPSFFFIWYNFVQIFCIIFFNFFIHFILLFFFFFLFKFYSCIAAIVAPATAIGIQIIRTMY